MIDDSKIDRLDRFGKALLSKRQKAIQARKKSGIEEIWDQDSEYYEGIDDANRGEVSTSITKNLVDRGGYSRVNRKRIGSNVFMNITKQYTDIAAMSLADMLLPVDDANFEVRPTPKPATMELLQVKPVDVGVVMYKNQQMPVEQFEETIKQDAKKKAEEAQKQIEDWLVEAHWNREVRKVLRDSAILGTGVVKGCYPIIDEQNSVHKMFQKQMPTPQGEMQAEGVADVKVIEIRPASKRIDVRNFYPDPACGDDIHSGSFVWERDYITKKELRNLRKAKGYISSQIDLVLKEGADDDLEKKRDKTNFGDRFEVWYYYGEATKDDLEAADCTCGDSDTYDVVVVIVNNRVIKATMNPLESGEFPYDVMVWQPMNDTWTGIGVARQVREPQRIINAATRNLLDNAGKGGRPTTIIADGVESADGGLVEVGSGALLRLSPDSPIQDARGAISSIIIPIITQDLMAIIQYALKMAEDITGLPMMLQGQQGNAPDTVGGMTMLQNNAGTIRRNIARNFDDRVTVPHITRYYEWIMLYGDEQLKGDFNIEARGSTVLFERDAQHQAIMQLGALVMNPAFQINPAKWIDEAFKAQRLDSKRFKFSEEEIKQMQAQAQQNPPQDPKVAGQIEVAKVRAAGEMDKAKFLQSTDMAEMQVKETLAMQELKFKAQQAEVDRQHEIQMKQMERDMKIMELSQSTQISVAEIKSQLAQTAQKLNVQTQLSKQVLTPPTEPAGRAPNGQAYQK